MSVLSFHFTRPTAQREFFLISIPDHLRGSEWFVLHHLSVVWFFKSLFLCLKEGAKAMADRSVSDGRSVLTTNEFSVRKRGKGCYSLWEALRNSNCKQISPAAPDEVLSFHWRFCTSEKFITDFSALKVIRLLQDLDSLGNTYVK